MWVKERGRGREREKWEEREGEKGRKSKGESEREREVVYINNCEKKSKTNVSISNREYKHTELQQTSKNIMSDSRQIKTY